MPLSAIVDFFGLLFLFLATVPLGAMLLRAVEWGVGRRFKLSTPERVLSAFFSSGALLFVIASLPIPVYGSPLVFGLLAFGGAAIVGTWWREGWTSPRTGLEWLRSWPGLILVAGTLALLAMELVATEALLLPNSNDGSFESLFVQLILSGHTLPWTYQPYAAIGIIYPAGAAAWLTLPVLLFGWPISSGPIILPPLFLSLSLVGSYCWGERLGGFTTSRGRQTGLLFAGFFGLIGSWPRFFVGDPTILHSAFLSS